MTPVAGPRPLRVGVAGLGFGLEVHVPGFRGIPGVEIAGLLCRNEARAAELAAKLRVPVLTDVDQWLDLSFDLVSLALPPADLVDVATKALDRGLPVLAEKPLGFDERSARTLASRAVGRPTAVDFEFAELPAFMALRDVIAAGGIGSIRHTAIVWLTESWAHRGGGWSWKTDSARHGGVLNLNGTHLYFLVEWILGAVDRLTARLDSRASSRLAPSASAAVAEDLAHVLMNHRSGCVTSMVFGNANPGLATHSWTIVGDRGCAIVGNTGRDYMAGFTLDVIGPDGVRVRRVAESRAEGDGRLPPFRRLVERFVGAVRSGEEFSPDFSAGVRVAALVDATRRASKSGGWVSVGADP